MVKMIRALLMLGGVLLTAAAPDTIPPPTSDCALNGAEAMDEMLDSAMYIWASVKRCGEGGNKYQCAVDVATSVESVDGMISVIMKAIQGCGGLQSQKAECAVTATDLTKAVAGLAAHTTEALATCKVPGVSPASSDTLPGTMDDAGTYGYTKFGGQKLGMCLVDVKSTAASFFKSIKSIMTVSKHSKVENALRIIEAFASMGSYIAAAIGHCSANENSDVDCAGAALGLAADLHSVVQSSMALSSSCQLDEKQRLYLEDADAQDEIAPASSGSSMTLALVAFLPIVAVVSFVGGSRFAKARSNAPTPQFESLMEAPPVTE